MEAKLKLTEMQREIFENCYNYCVNENEKSIKNAREVGGEFLYGKYAEFIFSIGEDLLMSYECRFLALELFNKFMKLHLDCVNESYRATLQSRLRSHPYTSHKTITSQVLDEYLYLLDKQVALRAISCLQIASKTVLAATVLSPIEAKSILIKMKLNYSLRSVIESEIRVLKTLSFSTIFITPCNFLELFCDYLAIMYESPTNLSNKHSDALLGDPVRHLYDKACTFLQFFYIIRPLFYFELYRQVTKNEHIQDQDKIFIARISVDHLLLAVGIIALASYAVWGEKQHVEVVHQLSTLTSLSENDIADVTRVFGGLLACSFDHLVQKMPLAIVEFTG